MAISTKLNKVQTQTPVFKAAIIYTQMSDWNTNDTVVSLEAVETMQRGITAAGIDATAIPVRKDVVEAVQALDPGEYVIFNWCEGLDGAPNAYDAVPPVLEQAGFAYTGSDAWALATSQNKAIAKKLLLDNKIPTPVSKVYERAVLNGWRRYPALVKPATEHCSFGITREAVVDSPQQLKDRVQYVLDTWHCPALVEDFIDGVEFNVSIWGPDDDLTVLPLGAIDYSIFTDYHDRLCTFDAKWNVHTEAFQKTEVQCPAQVEPLLKRRIERVALKAYRALRLRDYGRVDLRVRNNVPYVLDINANPDITTEGGFARSARMAGYDYGQAMAHLLKLAARRLPRPL